VIDELFAFCMQTSSRGPAGEAAFDSTLTRPLSICLRPGTKAQKRRREEGGGGTLMGEKREERRLRITLTLPPTVAMWWRNTQIKAFAFTVHQYMGVNISRTAPAICLCDARGDVRTINCTRCILPLPERRVI
jgi:hypothetical protein